VPDAPGRPSDQRLLLTPKEAAQVLAIGRSKVYDLMRSEEIFSIRIGGSRRIPVSALEEFVGRLCYTQNSQSQVVIVTD
jgi:excisionase family DNA binding protein